VVVLWVVFFSSSNLIPPLVMKLTDIKCKSAKPKEKPYKLVDGDRMYLLVSNTGAKYWRVNYRFHGKDKTLSLGVYPQTSLAEAREKRLQARKLIEQGLDPSLEKKKIKLANATKSANTFEAIAREWFEQRKSRWRPRYADDVIKRLENDIFPHIGSYPITDIEPPILLQVIKGIEKRGAYDLAKRQLQKCGEIFRYAIACGKASRDSSADIKDALTPTKKEHFACIEFEELPKFLQAINQNKARLYPTTLNALRLIMLTFVRTSELINAKWEEIDLEKKRWVIPAERMKMGKEHIVPLANQAIKILEEQKIICGGFFHIFPSPVKPRQAISNNTILGALKRLGYKGEMTGHGFRALAMSTIKQELGYRHEVIDRQLAHVHKSKIDKAYDRAMFLEERTIMMQKWADYLDNISP
jgi:integrase